jgi:hypothetical protein
MGNFLKKYFLLISLLFIVLFVFTAWQFPSVAPALGIVFFCISMGIAISAIIAKHRPDYQAGRLTRSAFVRNIGLDVFGVLLAVVLAALLARYVAELVQKQIDGKLLRLIAGVLVALVIGIGVGMLVRQLWGRLVKTSPRS